MIFLFASSIFQVKKGRNENMLEKSIFDLLMQKSSTTTPRPLIERLLQPFLEPITIELKKLEKVSHVVIYDGNKILIEMQITNNF